MNIIMYDKSVAPIVQPVSVAQTVTSELPPMNVQDVYNLGFADAIAKSAQNVTSSITPVVEPVQNFSLSPDTLIAVQDYIPTASYLPVTPIEVKIMNKLDYINHLKEVRKIYDTNILEHRKQYDIDNDREKYIAAITPHENIHDLTITSKQWNGEE